jgi:CRP-like cAMP-binding protein
MSSAIIQQGDVRNVILASLPAGEFEAIARHLEPERLKHGERLYEPQEAIRYVHFVNSGLLSLLSTLEDGTSIEVAALGREGMGGLSVLLGSDVTTHTGIIQAPGYAFRMRTEQARDAFQSLPAFQHKVLRYTRMLMSLIAFTAACNTMHTVEERLARWLLMCKRRLESDELPVTQEFLSHMLGVRRSGVTVAVGILERAGLIRHSRGTVFITDEEKLNDASCECIHAMTNDFDGYVNE